MTKRISKTKAKLCSLATKACLKARWQHSAGAPAEQRREASKCINYICTIKRYLSKRSVHVNKPLQKKKKAILTEYLLLVSDIQKYSSDCFQIKLNKPAGKKTKTKNGFPLRNQRTCIYSNVMQKNHQKFEILTLSKHLTQDGL